MYSASKTQMCLKCPFIFKKSIEIQHRAPFHPARSCSCCFSVPRSHRAPGPRETPAGEPGDRRTASSGPPERLKLADLALLCLPRPAPLLGLASPQAHPEAPSPSSVLQLPGSPRAPRDPQGEVSRAPSLPKLLISLHWRKSCPLSPGSGPPTLWTF